MKKISLLLIVLFLLSGCTDKTKEREKALLEAGRDYYESFGTEYQVDEYFVTLEQLKIAKRISDKKYDLTILDDCEEDTTITFRLKDGKIAETTYELNCK